MKCFHTELADQMTLMTQQSNLNKSERVHPMNQLSELQELDHHPEYQHIMTA
ncbi:hypothetical protein EMPG_11440, partial [Blastomyces silverae]